MRAGRKTAPGKKPSWRNFEPRPVPGGVADEWVTQLLRQTDAQGFKKYSQMKLQMKRKALTKLNPESSETDLIESSDTNVDLAEVKWYAR